MIKDIIFWLIYLGLAGTSVLFVHQTLLDFWNSKTFFVTSTTPLGSLDIPTLTETAQPWLIPLDILKKSL